jgi:hypothetical protein
MGPHYTDIFRARYTLALLKPVRLMMASTVAPDSSRPESSVVRELSLASISHRGSFALAMPSIGGCFARGDLALARASYNVSEIF